MITFLIAFIIFFLICGWNDYGDFSVASGLVCGFFCAAFISFCVSLFWAGSQAHYTDLATPIETQVINGEAQLTFTDINNKMYAIPATAVVPRVCVKDQVVTYTSTQPTWKWVIFPSASPDRSDQQTAVCVSAK